MLKWLRTFISSASSPSARAHITRQIETEARVLKYLDREYDRTQKSAAKQTLSDRKRRLRQQQEKRQSTAASIPSRKTLRWLSEKDHENKRLLLLLQRLRELRMNYQHQQQQPAVSDSSNNVTVNEGSGDGGGDTTEFGIDSHLIPPVAPRLSVAQQQQSSTGSSNKNSSDDDDALVDTNARSQLMAKHYARSQFFRHHLRHVVDASAPFPELPVDNGDVFTGFLVKLDAANSIKTELRQLNEGWKLISSDLAVNAGLATNFRHSRLGLEYCGKQLSSSADEIRTELMTKGYELYNEGRFDEAIETFTLAIKKGQGRYAGDFLQRAHCYFEKENYIACVADCENALRIDNQCARTHFTLGSGLFLLGKYDESIIHFQRATVLDPSSKRNRQFLKVAMRKRSADRAITRRRSIASTARDGNRATPQLRIPSLQDMAGKYTSCCVTHDALIPGMPRPEDFDYSRPSAVLEAWQKQKRAAIATSGKSTKKSSSSSSVAPLTDTEYEHYVDQCRTRLPDPLDRSSIDAIILGQKISLRLFFALSNGITGDYPEVETTAAAASSDRKKDSGNVTSSPSVAKKDAQQNGEGSSNSGGGGGDQPQIEGKLLDDIRAKVSATFKSFDSVGVDSFPQWVALRNNVALAKEADVIKGVSQFEQKLAQFKRIDRSSARPEVQ